MTFGSPLGDALADAAPAARASLPGVAAPAADAAATVGNLARSAPPPSALAATPAASAAAAGAAAIDAGFSPKVPVGNPAVCNCPDGPIVDEIVIERIRAIPKGGRPDPSTYIAQADIDAHLAKFEGGASYLVPKDILDTYGRDMLGWPDNTQFVMSGKEMDDLLKRANGDMALIENELGIPPGAWQGKEMVRITIPSPKDVHLRMPSGNEAGANAHWIPGGRLPTGKLEAVCDAIPKGKYVETPI